MDAYLASTSDVQAAAAPNPVNVEDCITATRALNKAVELKGEGKVSFAVIGGVAVASLTRKFLGPTPTINWANVVNRQTKMSVLATLHGTGS